MATFPNAEPAIVDWSRQRRGPFDVAAAGSRLSVRLSAGAGKPCSQGVSLVHSSVSEQCFGPY